jgi:hypothetical protein
MALERELATYEAKLEELLAQEGKYVVIHGETVVGTWDTYEAALAAAYERCGLEPFLVKQIAWADTVHNFTRDLPLCPQ